MGLVWHGAAVTAELMRCLLAAGKCVRLQRVSLQTRTFASERVDVYVECANHVKLHGGRTDGEVDQAVLMNPR